MSYDAQVTDKLRSNFELLRTVIRYSKQPDLKVDLSRIEDIIGRQIPETLQKNAPADFHVLFTNFKNEFEKFKDFVLFDKLIGKNVVSLGGGFSSGKSSFLNALMGKRVLPADIDPSTSVPTYIVNGPDHQVQGINIFNTKIDLELKAIQRITHGFGKVDDEHDRPLTDPVTLGHVMNSIFLTTPWHHYNHIAFLDTPGYSKADNKNHSAKTDEQIARTHLNSSQFILWFIQADAGTITEEDITFIRSLREDIPKLIIVNKADKKPEQDLREIIAKTKKVLDLKGIAYLNVLAFSNVERDQYDSAAIRDQLDRWNAQVYESKFARNFKTIFIRCKQFYENEIEQESRRLNRLNKSRTLTDDPTISECLDSLITEISRSIAALKSVNQALKQLQTDFFTELKLISDLAGIAMPEPSEIELIQESLTNPLQLLRNYRQMKGLSSDDSTFHLLQNTFNDMKPVIAAQPGGSTYIDQLVGIIQSHCVIKQPDIHIQNECKASGLYAEIFNTHLSLGE
ncbi:dynamin family protein [Paenibacillus ihuae]|uniref:dynamin family protein n=1 Tax=Paenibacillus ihuae TaxID=1232431 RepID=UPI0006D55DD3|nr:dynamin family protein [Paenibacillus ihuae]